MKRDRRLFDSTGAEVVVHLVCTGPCGLSKPFAEFGIRKSDGKLRSISQCNSCRARYYRPRAASVEPRPLPDGAGL